MINYGDVFGDVWRTLGAAILVIIFYSIGKFISQEYKPRWKSCLIAIATVGFLSFIMWSNYGTHTEDADPIYGGDDEVTDFVPTDQQRNEYGLALFVKMAIPALVGAYTGKSKDNSEV